MLLRACIRRPALGLRSTAVHLQPFSSHRRIPPFAHPSYSSLSSELALLPHFRTRAENVRVLNQPSEFYATLLVSPETTYNTAVLTRRGGCCVAGAHFPGQASHLHRFSVHWQGGD